MSYGGSRLEILYGKDAYTSTFDLPLPFAGLEAVERLLHKNGAAVFDVSKMIGS
jgi:hypothetical protein